MVAQRLVHPRNRVTTAIDDRFTVPRPGDTHPLARPPFHVRPAAPDTPMERMILVLSPDADQQAALDQLLAAQQDPGSPDYQRWLTPEEFGNQFGVSEDDISAIVSWLQGYGFTVEPVSPARQSIVFSGTAAQVVSAFHTEIHVYNVNGESHYANASAPEIPVALDAVVQGIASLYDFYSTPMLSAIAPVDGAPSGILPEWSPTSGTHYVAPADFATIYDVSPLFSSTIDGTGQSIAVAGRSNIHVSDVQTFRSTFGLPANNPTVIVNGTDPGVLSNQAEQAEATLDVEWAGAAAKQAVVQFVVSASTNATDGVDLSVQYIVNHNLAPVVSLSFGSCERSMGASWNQHWNALWQQAAAQGMSVMVASGDSGAAGCDSGSATAATGGQNVNGLCSSPYSTCVGGTKFNDASNPGLYWSASNSSSLGSALSYVPEAVWNESASAGGSGLWAAGGGPSMIYSKPSWQTGPGVPSDGRRDVPDVALNAASHDAEVICMNGGLYTAAGTSVAAPSFASLVALAVQKASAWLGNVNPALYTLASKQAAGGAHVFHDVTTGNNSVPGLTGYNAAVGYDLASGLGSVDAALMVNHWSDAGVAVPSFLLSASPASISVTKGTAGSTALTLTRSGGFNASVTLSASGLPAGVTAAFSPATIPATSSASTLTLTASSSVTGGSTGFMIAASGGGLTRTAPVTITIPVCTYAISPASASPGAAAGTYTVQVTAGAGCSWTAVANASWITVTGGASGSGNGTVSYSVAANTALTTRSGAIAVAGLSLGVTQAAATSSVSLNSVSANVGAAASTGTVAVSAGTSTASWTAVSNVSWITVTSGATGSGSRSVGYSVAANTGSSRTGTLTIAGLTFTVVQAGSTATGGFTLSASPSSVGLAPGYSASANISVVGSGGFNGSVTMAASGLPAGVTAKFAPAAVAPGGTSILTLTVAPTATAVTGSLTVSGTSGSLSATAPLGLTSVGGSTTAGFTLKAASSSLTVGWNSSVSTTVTLVPVGGFAGYVTLGVTGLPCEVQAVFTPAMIRPGDTATLKLTSIYGSAVTTHIAITGVSGTLSATTSLSLTANTVQPGFDLTANPPFLSLPPGSKATTTITMQPNAGFAATATLWAFPPPGVTATFSQPSITPGVPVTLTLTASASAPAATGWVQVEGEMANTNMMGNAFISLNAAKPGFTLGSVVLPPSLQTLTGWLDSGILINDFGGFSGNINFTFSGLPAGVIGSFDPIEQCGGPNCRDVRFELAAGVTAVATPSTPVTITGTSGALSASTTFNIAVAPGGFSVSPPIAGWTDSWLLTAPVGGAAKVTLLGVGNGKGFTVSVTGAPPTATTSIVSSPPSGYVVTIATTAQTAPGCYPLKLTGYPPGQAPYTSQWPLYLTVTQ